MASPRAQIPATPRVISPSPTPSDASNRDGYFSSRVSSSRISSPGTISEAVEDNETSDPSDPELQRARSRSRNPSVLRRNNTIEVETNNILDGKSKAPTSNGINRPTRRKPDPRPEKSRETKGHLSPQSANAGFGRDYWRQLSRSPSPLGLIPIHEEWRKFIHKHEIPRKVLHVAIGFLTIILYLRGVQPASIHPILLSMLIPIFLVDVVRLHYAPFNRIYIRTLGAFMRESEAHDRYNGVISYLAGAWFALYFCSKDVGAVAIILLSWCDTAASTFGRQFGHLGPRIRKGKSLAGSLAAFVIGVGVALLFWGFLRTTVPQNWNTGINEFAFDGTLSLPAVSRASLASTKSEATIEGPLALAATSVVTGLIASISEALDVFDLDDNLTIPVLCGIGLEGFFRANR